MMVNATGCWTAAVMGGAGMGLEMLLLLALTHLKGPGPLRFMSGLCAMTYGTRRTHSQLSETQQRPQHIGSNSQGAGQVCSQGVRLPSRRRRAQGEITVLYPEGGRGGRRRSARGMHSKRFGASSSVRCTGKDNKCACRKTDETGARSEASLR